MKGYWHVIAIAVLMSMLTITLHSYVFFIGLLFWLLYLFYKGRLRKLPLFLSLAFYLGFLLYIPSISLPPDHPSLLADDSIFGEIISPPTFTETNIQFILQAESTKEKVNIHYFFNQDSEIDIQNFSSLAYGAKCQLQGPVEFPEQSRNPGQFDYQKYLLSQGITYQLTIDSVDDFHCEGRKLLDVIYSLRMNLIHNVTNSLSEDTAGWLNALVLGDDSNLNEDVIDLFQRWSLSHILAISGLHVGLITALVYFLLVKLNVVTKETSQTIIIVFLPFYAFLAGGAPSVWRASLMGLAFLLLAKKQINYSLTDILSIVFISLIALDKYIVYQIGFQLSFLVTFGLLLSRNWFMQTESSMWKILKISFIAQMMIVPLQLIYFSTFHPLSIILNSIVVPYFSLFVIPAMLLLFLLSPFFPLFATVFDFIFSQIQGLLIQLLQFVDHYFYFPWVIGNLPLITVLIFYMLLFFMMISLERGQLQKAFRSGIYIVGLLTLLVLRPYFSPIGTVTMLDIGQGDAYVIELPFRKSVFLVDAGATFSFRDFEPSKRVYKQIIRPYLYSRGIREVDAIFVSHEDLDHNGSVPFMIKDMKVKKMIISSYYIIDDLEQEVISNNNVQVERVTYRDEIEIGGQKFTVAAPISDQNDENENSLVLKTMLGGKIWLFTGDIGTGVELELIKHDEDLSIDVLKVAHHGSNTSTHQKFIEQTSPEYALISAGVNNRYGHPTPEVIATLEDENVTILRTDKHGAVQFRFRNNKGTFYTYLP